MPYLSPELQYSSIEGQNLTHDSSLRFNGHFPRQTELAGSVDENHYHYAKPATTSGYTFNK